MRTPEYQYLSLDCIKLVSLICFCNWSMNIFSLSATPFANLPEANLLMLFTNKQTTPLSINFICMEWDESNIQKTGALKQYLLNIYISKCFFRSSNQRWSSRRVTFLRDYSQLQIKINLPSINIIFLIFFSIAIPAKIFIRTLTKETLEEDLKKREIHRFERSTELFCSAYVFNLYHRRFPSFHKTIWCKEIFQYCRRACGMILLTALLFEQAGHWKITSDTIQVIFIKYMFMEQIRFPKYLYNSSCN